MFFIWKSFVQDKKQTFFTVAVCFLQPPYLSWPLCSYGHVSYPIPSKTWQGSGWTGRSANQVAAAGGGSPKAKGSLGWSRWRAGGTARAVGAGVRQEAWGVGCIANRSTQGFQSNSGPARMASGCRVQFRGRWAHGLLSTPQVASTPEELNF